MTTTTLVIAIVGLVLSVVSLGWQAATFRFSGPRVRVTLSEGLRGPLGAMIASPSVYTEAGRHVVESQGYTEPLLAIGVTNAGRMAVTIDRWTLRFGNKAAFQNPTDPRNPPLPYRLDAHSSATWYADLEPLRLLQATFSDQSVKAGRIIASVDLGNGTTVKSKTSVIVRA